MMCVVIIEHLIKSPVISRIYCWWP